MRPPAGSGLGVADKNNNAAPLEPDSKGNAMAIPDLRNKQALITGGAAGIGLETALAFARAGAHIVLTDINTGGLAAAAESVRQLGVDCRVYTVDVADAAAMRRLADDVDAAVGAVDVLVNNAGIGYCGPFIETPVEAWRRVLDINLMGVVHGCTAFLPQMLAAGGPRRVVNVASGAGLGPIGGLSAYVASKHAVVGLSDTLALELATTPVGITVVCPGIINTAIVQFNERNAGPSVTRAQGERINAYYRDHGCSPSVVGDVIVDAVRTGRGLVTPGPGAAMARFGRRLLPRDAFLRLSASASRKIGYLR